MIQHAPSSRRAGHIEARLHIFDTSPVEKLTLSRGITPNLVPLKPKLSTPPTRRSPPGGGFLADICAIAKPNIVSANTPAEREKTRNDLDGQGHM